MGKVKLVLGDWSSDGHGKSDEYIFETNKTVEEIQKAYKASCKLTGLSFNHNEDYTELKLDWQHLEYGDRHICTEYESHEISKLAEGILLNHGIDVWEGYDMNYHDKDENCPIDGQDHFVDLWISFVKLSLPDLEMTKVKDEIPVINGWWNKELNVQFGYGLYD